jgi:hypothetical protein
LRRKTLYSEFFTGERIHLGLPRYCSRREPENYKGHHIWSVPRQLPDSRRWTSHVVINWTDGSRQVQAVFEVKRGFAIQEEAEREGLTFAKKWIDDGKPKLRERGTGPG